jgi:pimeloyl-ACP methyl ester carboxylesterase
MDQPDYSLSLMKVSVNFRRRTMSTGPDNSSLYKSTEGFSIVMEHYDQTLQERAIPHESRFVETSYGSTHIATFGADNARPLVLWHGQNANVLSWLHWIPYLLTDFRCYAIDVIGGMGKSAPSRPSKKGPAYGQWAAEVLEGLELEQASMIGASQGAWQIIKLANVAPERIENAILLSAAGFLPLNLLMVLRTLPRVVFKPTEEAARAMVDVVTPPDVQLDPFFLDIFVLMMQHFRSEAAPPVLPDEEIKELNAPTYLLMGQYETAVKPYKVIKRGVELLPNLIKAEIVPGVGHSMIHKEPDWVISRVVDFIKQQNDQH